MFTAKHTEPLMERPEESNTHSVQSQLTEEENITTIEFIHQRMKWGFSQTNTIQFWQAWPESWIELWRASCWDTKTQPSSRLRERNIAKYSHHDSLDIINFHLFMVCFGWTELIITISFTWHWDSCYTFSNITLCPLSEYSDHAGRCPWLRVM